ARSLDTGGNTGAIRHDHLRALGFRPLPHNPSALNVIVGVGVLGVALVEPVGAYPADPRVFGSQYPGFEQATGTCGDGPINLARCGSLIGADFLGFHLHGGSPSGLVGPGELPLTGAFLYAAT